MSTLSSRHGWKILRSDANACTCTPENPRHVEGHQCITPAQLAAWIEHEPMAVQYRAACRTEDLRDAMSKRLAWLWLHFSQDAEAKRLSGRP